MNATRFVCLATVLLLAAGSARAIPPFARKYSTSCGTCHATVYPKLNPFGRRFKMNGYQYPDGAEESYAATSGSKLGDSDELLSLLKSFPLSLRIKHNITIARKGAAGAQGHGTAEVAHPISVFG